MMKQIFTVLTIVMLMAGVCSASSEMYCIERTEDGVPVGSTCSIWRGYTENAEGVPVCDAIGGCGQCTGSVETCNWDMDSGDLGCTEMSAQEVSEIIDGNWVEAYSASMIYYAPFAWYHHLIYNDYIMATIVGILSAPAFWSQGEYYCDDCTFTEIFYADGYSLPVFVRTRSWSTGDKFWN